MNVLFWRASYFILYPSSFILLKDFLVKIYQLYRRGGGFKTLVTQLNSSAIDRLVHCVCSYNSEDYGHSRLQSCFADSSGYFSSDVFEMRSLAANDRAETNYRRKFFGFRKSQSEQRNFKSAGDPEDLYLFLIRSQTLESVKRAINQTRADEVVPPTGDNRKTKSLTV